MTPGEMRARYEANATIQDLCDETGESYRQVREALIGAGTVLRKPMPRTPSAPPGMVEAYVILRQPLETVGKPWGIGRDKAKRMLREAGVPIRERGRPPKSQVDLWDE